MRILLALLTITTMACDLGGGGGSGGHGHEHGGDEHGDEHAADEHGHSHPDDGRPTRGVTMFADGYQLFVEYAELTVGEPSEFAAHFTRLEDFQPIAAGSASIVLTGENHPGENWNAENPQKEGLFLPTAQPRYAGERRLFVVLKTADATVRFDLGTVIVSPDLAAAKKVKFQKPHGDVDFLMEQQWRVDFGLAPVVRSTVRASVVVNARVRPASDAEARVTAPVAGRIVADEGGMPSVGETVEAGQILARIVPRLAAGEVSRMRAGATQAGLTLRRAKQERDRVAGLVEQGALPGRRLVDADHAVAMAQSASSQARSSLGQYQSMESSSGRGTVVVRAPVSGVVAHRRVVDGAYVENGQKLIHIVDRSRLWLEAQVPEASLDRMGNPTGAWFELPDGSDTHEIGEGRVVAFGQVVDPTTRTVPLIFALDDPPESLRVGAFVSAHVLTGEPREAVVVPTSARLEEEGTFVVFVMKSGESFERRNVQLGVQDRGLVEVVAGVEAGEWVVSPGAYFVKLASAATGSIGHGHAH